MTVLGAAVVPHPPLIVPQVGRGAEKQVEKTIKAYREAAQWVAEQKPETVVIISPHSAAYEAYIHLSPGSRASGDFGKFGAREIRFEINYDEELTKAIAVLAQKEGLSAGTMGEREPSLDHGCMVPLYFLREASDGKLPYRFVRIGLSSLTFEAHYRLGMLIKIAAEQLGRRFCVIASGDLSHYLNHDGPYGFRKEGPGYDAQVMDVLARAAFDELLRMPADVCARAGECGQRSFLIMAGCLDGLDVNAKYLSYEGVTGVGYGVCLFEVLGSDDRRRFLEIDRSVGIETHIQSDPYVATARLSYEHYVKYKKPISRPENLPDVMITRQAGVFVSLKIDGQLRGCIGTISPTAKCIADEIIQNAISAATRDPRFRPVTQEELPYIDCSVDVLEEPEDISSPVELDVKEYGVIVSNGSRRGLLLPNLDGVDTVGEQIGIARRKAGIAPGDKVTLQRFRVVRHT